MVLRTGRCENPGSVRAMDRLARGQACPRGPRPRPRMGGAARTDGRCVAGCPLRGCAPRFWPGRTLGVIAGHWPSGGLRRWGMRGAAYCQAGAGRRGQPRHGAGGTEQPMTSTKMRDHDHSRARRGPCSPDAAGRPDGRARCGPAVPTRALDTGETRRDFTLCWFWRAPGATLTQAARKVARFMADAPFASTIPAFFRLSTGCSTPQPGDWAVQP